MTASEEIGHDASVFFHNMATFNLQGTYEHLLVAPSSLQDGIIKRIEREKMKAESFQPCGIFMKMNSLTDRKIIDELSKASNAEFRYFADSNPVFVLNPQEDREYPCKKALSEDFWNIQDLCIWSWR